MTDITKYKNVTLTKETYSNIQTLSKEVFDIPISLSKTIQYFKRYMQLSTATKMKVLEPIFNLRLPGCCQGRLGGPGGQLASFC